MTKVTAAHPQGLSADKLNAKLKLKNQPNKPTPQVTRFMSYIEFNYNLSPALKILCNIKLHKYAKRWKT